MNPALDPDLAAVVASLPEMNLSDLAALRALPPSPTLPYDGVDVVVVAAPGLDGAPDVPVRLMRPAGVTRVLPVLLALHGGGFVIGRAEDFDYFCLEVVRRLGIAVANVEYRLAPETPFPGPQDDCTAALRHVHARAAELGLDPERIAVGGSSAGGGLAAGTVLRARDEGGPPVAFQLLLSPAIDDSLDSPSMTELVDAPLASSAAEGAVWRHYLGADYGGPDDPDVSPYAVPARAKDLSGLPPTHIAAMEVDPLRDSNIQFALRLLAAGVRTELHSHPGTFHGSVELAPHAESSARIQQGLLDALRRGLR